MLHQPDQLSDPDLYSVELNHWLVVDGRRSANVRRLMRLARGNPELERIFETKLAEHRRFLRESRKPTLLNLPARCCEWLWEHVQFAPPREAVLTLFYVGVAVLGVEYVKGTFFPAADAANPPLPDAASIESLLSLESTATAKHEATTDGVDEWFSSEVNLALDKIIHSAEFKQKLRSVVAEAIDEEIAAARARHAAHPNDDESNPEEAEPTDDASTLEPTGVDEPTEEEQQ